MTSLEPLTASQQHVFDKLLIECRSVAIVSQAGTGKSHIIKHIKKYCNDNKMRFAITAMTGVAASIIGGQTIHRWSGLKLLDKPIDISVASVRKNHSIMKKWKDVQILVIDEISMMDKSTFEKLHYVAQIIRKNHDDFFGGIRVFLSGDFYQLPPIKTTEMCFESHIWKQYLQSALCVFDLKEILRQNDPVFTHILKNIREGIITKDIMDILNSRLIENVGKQNLNTYITDNENDDDNRNFLTIKPTLLYPFKNDVNNINEKEFNKLLNIYSKETFMAIDSKYDHNLSQRISESDKIILQDRALEQLDLCIGAQVMLTVNIDVENGLVNGARGVIVDFVKDSVCESNRKKHTAPVVVFYNGIELKIDYNEFTFELNDYEILKRVQIPLILSWALTIHKSQGSTLTNVITNLGNVFCHGQAYVALSRVKSLDGLFLQNINYNRITCDPKVKEFYESTNIVSLTL